MTHYNLTQIRGAWGAGYAAAEKALARDLVGMYCHPVLDGVIERQGKVVGKEGDGVYRVQWFSWWLGEPTQIEVVRVNAMTEWRFYTDRRAWIAEGDRTVMEAMK